MYSYIAWNIAISNTKIHNQTEIWTKLLIHYIDTLLIYYMVTYRVQKLKKHLLKYVKVLNLVKVLSKTTLSICIYLLLMRTILS